MGGTGSAAGHSVCAMGRDQGRAVGAPGSAQSLAALAELSGAFDTQSEPALSPSGLLMQTERHR